MTNTDNAPLTNRQVADQLGISESGVSRLRSGGRVPSDRTMVRIAAIFDWTMTDQFSARISGTYTEQFRARVCRDTE